MWLLHSFQYLKTASRVTVILFCGFAIPVFCLDDAERNSDSVFVAISELILGFRQTELGRFREIRDHFIVIDRFVAVAVLQRQADTQQSLRILL